MVDGRIVVYGLHDVRDGVIRFVSTTANDPKQGLANYRSQSKRFRQGVFGWLHEIGVENAALKIVREFPFTDARSRDDAEKLAKVEKETVIARLRSEGVAVLNTSRTLSVAGVGLPGMVEDVLRRCIENPRHSLTVDEGMSFGDAKVLAATIRNKGFTVSESEGARGRWAARMVRGVDDRGLWDVTASFEPYRKQRYESSKPKPVPESSWNAGAREWLHSIGMSDDDIQLGT